MKKNLGHVASLFAVISLMFLGGCATEGGTNDSRVNVSVFVDPKAPDPTGVVDKHCARIVQPYALGDNVGALAQIALEMKLEQAFLDRKSPEKSGKQIGETVRRVAKQLNWLPMELEVERGRMQHAARHDVVPEDKRTAAEYAYARKVLDEILASVGEPHAYKFQLFLLAQDGENAEARPGGYLYVDRPLVRDAMKQESKSKSAPQKKAAKKSNTKQDASAGVKGDEKENEKRARLYFALAHEVAHVLQRHETKHLQNQIVDSITTASELHDLIKASKEKPASILKYAANTVQLFAKHYAQQEMHADACAVRLLHQTFANDRKLEAALQVFIAGMGKELEPDPPELTGKTNAEQYLSSLVVLVKTDTQRHPNTRARTDNLHAMVAEIRSGKFSLQFTR